MNINRYNYEEFLMLYIDGELSSEEQQAVEHFLQQNPDVKEELDLLQQTVLQPEHIVFVDKKALFKTDSGINLTNYEEYFCLYIDNELSFVQREEVETFVLQHPQLQDEFTLLKQTILPKENIAFVDKGSLYKKEEKRRPVVIPMNYRWASLAAAVLVGVIALVWVLRDDSALSNKNETASVNPSTEVKSPIQQKDKPQENLAVSQDLADQKDDIATSKSDQFIPLTKDNKTELLPGVTKENLASLNNKAARAEQRTIAATYPGEEVKSNVGITLPNVDNISISSDEPYSSKVVPNADNDESFEVKPAAFSDELDVDEEDDKKTLLLGSVQINKDKLRGFFRKAGRLLTNKVKPEDGKLQVANVEINSLK